MGTVTNINIEDKYLENRFPTMGIRYQLLSLRMKIRSPTWGTVINFNIEDENIEIMFPIMGNCDLL